MSRVWRLKEPKVCFPSIESMETSSSTTATAPSEQPTQAPTSTSTATPAPPPSSSIPSTPEIPTSSPSQNPNQNSQSQIPLQHHQQQTQQQIQQQQNAQQIHQQNQQQTSFQHPQQKPPLNRIRPPTPYQHFSPHIPPSSSSSSATSSNPIQRGGVALGVPAHQAARPTQQPGSFSTFGPSSFNQPFGGLSNTQMTNPNTQLRQPVQGIQNTGMVGSLGPSSQVRSSGVPLNQQQRPGQPQMRSQTPSSNQSLSTQKLPGGMLRVPSMGSPNSPSPGTPQVSQSHSQPWMSNQGKQMHASALSGSSFRPQMKPQSLQQRSHLLQHPLPMTPQQQQMPSTHQQQPPSHSHQTPENHSQQYPASRLQQPLTHQPQGSRMPGSAGQKSLAMGNAQPGMVQSGTLNSASSTDVAEHGNQILTKRSIQELVSQIDPAEKVDPEVEDVLVEIADDFVESITTFACSLAKHRKSSTLEAKDILLHLERNWNMTLPGFSGDEIKSYKKPLANDIHKERLSAIKKSIVGSDTGNTRSAAGQAVGNTKGHAAKAPVIGSPKP